MTTEFGLASAGTRASKLRLILAWYLDLLWMLLVAFLLTYLLGTVLPTVVTYTTAGLASALLQRMASLSPGKFILSIDHAGMVDDTVKTRESWLTMTLATLFVIDASKQYVRWAQMSAWPFFGTVPEGFTAFSISIIGATLSLLVGYWLFKLERKGLYLGVTYVVVNIVSLWASRTVIMESIAQKTIERRALQGLPVRDGEIEFMQTLLPMAFLAFGILLISSLYFSRKRFR